MPAKSLGTPLQILPCFAISPSPPQNNVVLWSKNWHDRTICWDNNLRNQHCFGGEGVFEPDGYG